MVHCEAGKRNRELDFLLGSIVEGGTAYKGFAEDVGKIWEIGASV